MMLSLICGFKSIFNYTPLGSKGIAVSEVLASMAIISVLAGSLVVSGVSIVDDAKKAVCFNNQRTIELVDVVYALDHGSHAYNVEKLTKEGLLHTEDLDNNPCPAGGYLNWTMGLDGNMELTCSIHGSADEAKPPNDIIESLPE
jgi:hypothetical protein